MECCSNYTEKLNNTKMSAEDVEYVANLWVAGAHPPDPT